MIVLHDDSFNIDELKIEKIIIFCTCYFLLL